SETYRLGLPVSVSIASQRLQDWREKRILLASCIARAAHNTSQSLSSRAHRPSHKILSRRILPSQTDVAAKLANMTTASEGTSKPRPIASNAARPGNFSAG